MLGWPKPLINFSMCSEREGGAAGLDSYRQIASHARAAGVTVTIVCLLLHCCSTVKGIARTVEPSAKGVDARTTDGFGVCGHDWGNFSRKENEPSRTRGTWHVPCQRVPTAACNAT